MSTVESVETKIARIETELSYVRNSIEKCTDSVESLPGKFTELISAFTSSYEKRAFTNGERMGNAEGKIIALETKVEALKRFMWGLIAGAGSLIMIALGYILFGMAP